MKASDLLARMTRGSEDACGLCCATTFPVSWSPAFGAWLCEDCADLVTYTLLEGQ